MSTSYPGPPSNRDMVLTAIGRASAPPVAKIENGPSLGNLTGAGMQIESGAVLCIGSEEFIHLVQKHRSVVQGVPGMLCEIASNPLIETFIVEGRAFQSGPWIGADDHQSRHLAEEIFEAGRLLRARGGQAWFVPTSHPTGSMSARVLSTFTARLDTIPEVDLEEEATQSSLWAELVELTSSFNSSLGMQSPLGDSEREITVQSSER
ncbi:hypothetical protein PGC08_02735 [Brevibacterium sp. BDJS002]|uniref:hypothetical protein n=1 Tax=Brevibacterium sp. BDJS002 TaxID=3020906 RepID=UPI002307CEA9|nr:hypothetical protein [Brevibacterium sp. BDJS002]WCE40630.1 hypothetical protein PGC08_02735 [Brevibacterium sp. BDJS002]